MSSWTTSAGLELVATDGSCIYRIEAYKTIVVTVSAPTQADAAQATAAVLERAGDPPVGWFPAWVWHATDRGGTPRRDLAGPAWQSVASNYPAPARDQLASLIARDGLESAEARLILLHGEPGTGKTTAIRALLRAWAPWCEAHIIGDPDRLFDNVAYLLEVVGRPPAHTASTMTAAATGDRWKLLVAEDTDTFLRSTAGKDAGHGLSRLLNITDGLLGQLEKTLVLLTTNAPTNDAWITPWTRHLADLGVILRFDAPVVGFDCVGSTLASAAVSRPDGGVETVRADHFVAALPVEQMRLLVSPAMRAADPALARLDRLVTRWMNGIMYYLDEDVPVVHGHSIYIDSPWALTAISQRQFWNGIDLQDYGDGRVAGILSVDVSEWERPAPRLGKVAAKCTAEEIRLEVWSQLKDHLNDGDQTVLRDENVLAWSSTRPSGSPIPPTPPTSNRSSSTPPGRGGTVPRQRPGSTTSTWPRTMSNLHRPRHDGGSQ